MPLFLRLAFLALYRSDALLFELRRRRRRRRCPRIRALDRVGGGVEERAVGRTLAVEDKVGEVGADLPIVLRLCRALAAHVPGVTGQGIGLDRIPFCEHRSRCAGLGVSRVVVHRVPARVPEGTDLLGHTKPATIDCFVTARGPGPLPPAVADRRLLTPNRSDRSGGSGPRCTRARLAQSKAIA